MRWIGGGLGCFSRYYNITHNSAAPACTAYTDMVYLKEVERDVTTSWMGKAIIRLKTLVFIPSKNTICSIFLHPKNK